MATEVQINGGPGTAKIRHPVAVAAVGRHGQGDLLPLLVVPRPIREMVDLGRARNAEGSATTRRSRCSRCSQAC